MNHWTKRIGTFLLQVACTTLLMLGIHILMNGMFLLGIPKSDTVQKVVLSYPEKTSVSKEFTDRESIEHAVGLTNFLHYVPFAQADISEEPVVTITYYTDDSDPVSISANRNTVWWKGKAYKLKQEGFFINLTEGIFYLEESVTGSH